MIASDGIFKIGTSDVSKIYKGTVLMWEADVVAPPQNLILRSEEFNVSPWTVQTGATMTANQISAPDGTTTADLFKAGTGSFGGLLRQSFTYQNIEYTSSVYLKKNNYDHIGLRVYGASGGAVYPTINLADNTVSANGLTGLTIGRDVLADGWVRFWVRYMAGAGISNFDISFAASNGSIAFTPAGTELVYVWGAQLNEGGIRDYSKTVASIIP